MKKKLGNILIFVLIIGLTIGYGIYKDSQSKVTVNKIWLNRYIGDMLIYSTLMMSI